MVAPERVWVHRFVVTLCHALRFYVHALISAKPQLIQFATPMCHTRASGVQLVHRLSHGR